VLTYWLYTYIPWFFGFAAIALLAPAAVAVRTGEGKKVGAQQRRGNN
jgi:hypothetical protein